MKTKEEWFNWVELETINPDLGYDISNVVNKLIELEKESLMWQKAANEENKRNQILLKEISLLETELIRLYGSHCESCDRNCGGRLCEGLK